MTAHYCDFKNTDVFLTIGSNNAENHPVTAAWVKDAKEANGATYIVVDPRFTRSAALADIYAPLRSGTDIAFFGGLINYIFENNLYHDEYVKTYTNAPYLLNTTYSFDEAAGMFSGWVEGKDGKPGAYDPVAGGWGYQADGDPVPWDKTTAGWVDAPGVPKFNLPSKTAAKKDPTLQDPQTVFQVMKKHYSRYSTDMVSKICGTPVDKLEEIYAAFAATGAPDKAGSILYAMGQTQHTYGTQNIRAMAVLQLLLGNIGNPGGGIQALRGESNVQGSTDFALLAGNLPGYIAGPTQVEKHMDLAHWLAAETPGASYWQNKPKFLVSYLKEIYGENATVDNDYAYDLMPKVAAGNHTFIGMFEAISAGTIKGLMMWGQNPVVGGPNTVFTIEAMKKLDWAVSVDLWETESAIFWKAPGVDPASVNTEVYELPAAAHYEKQGSVSHSGRWIQWRYKVVEPVAESKDDFEIMHELHKKVAELYSAGDGAFADPITKLNWPYETDGHADITKVAYAINGYTVADGKAIANFTKLAADGSTACGNWIYSGYYNNNAALDDPTKQPTGSRVKDDPSGLGLHPRWSFSWPVNRRILYNRASCNPQGQPYAPNRPLVKWDEAAGKWLAGGPAFIDAKTGEPTPPPSYDVPDFVASIANADGSVTPVPPATTAFIMNPEGAARLFAVGAALKDGPFPEHYEPFESPVANLMSAQQTNPALTNGGAESVKPSDPSEFPVVCTTYRVSEHWQTGGMTRNIPWVNEAMPAMFVEVSNELAEDKGIKNGDMVKVWNNRGEIEVVAMVTPRFKPFDINGQVVHQIGMPWHWGYAGGGSIGASANVLTPNVGDANTSIPEYKAFLVNIEKA